MREAAKKLVKSSWFPAFFLLIVFAIINCFITRGFTSFIYLKGFMTSNVPIICVTLGVSAVIICGGTDISVGSMVSLINVLTLTLYKRFDLPMGTLIPIVIGIGILLGLINGIVVGVFRVNALMATFATSQIFSGIALWILPLPDYGGPRALSDWYGGTMFNVIPRCVLYALVALVLVLLIFRSTLGVGIYATGRDPVKAYLSGIPVERLKILSFVFSGFCCALGGLALTSATGSGDPKIGDSFTMTCIAACVIGGVNFNGGEGKPVGALFGILFLELVVTTVFSARLSSVQQKFANGVILLAAVVCAVISANRSRKSMNLV